MYLLDTNIIIGILRKKKEILAKYKDLSEKNQPIFLTTYTLSEIYLGFHNKSSIKEHHEKLRLQKELFNRMVIKLHAQNRIISLSVEDSKILGEIFHLLKEKGNPIPTIDAIIGSIAVSRDLIIITSDTNHFKVLKEVKPELKIRFW